VKPQQLAPKDTEMSVKNSIKSDPSLWVEHPLFPAEGDDPPPPIAFISVYRYEPSGPVQVMRVFRAEELQNESQISELYGGGMYELHGRRQSKQDATLPGALVSKRRVRIPGEPQPLSPGGVAKPAVVEPVKAAEPEMGVMTMFMQMQMNMMQMQEAAAARREEAQQREADRRAQETREAAERSRHEQSQFTTLIMNMNAQSQQTMATIMGAVLQKSGGGGTAELTQLVDVLKGLGMKLPGAEAADEGGGTDIGQVVADVADIVQGVAAMKGGAPVAPQVVLPQGPAGEGSAASLFGKKG
jgi:hypothetical protein